MAATTTPPRTATRTLRARKNAHGKGLEPGAAEHKHRRKYELPPVQTVFNQEFIDFDVIKGSAFFNTKPSKYDKRLVRQGFYRAILLPFFPKYWTQKAWQEGYDVIQNYAFYCVASVLYVAHLLLTLAYLFVDDPLVSPLTSFEIWAPYVLLTLTSCGYGRVSSLVLSADPDGHLTLHLNSPTSPVPAPKTAAKREHEGLDTALLESEGSSQESGESDSEGGGASSSSDEEVSGIKGDAANHDLDGGRRPSFNETFGEHFTRRRVKVVVWKGGVPIKESMTISELRLNILHKVKATPPRSLYRIAARTSAVVIALIPGMYRFLSYSMEHNIDVYDPAVLFKHAWGGFTSLMGLPYTTMEQLVVRHFCLESAVTVSCTATTLVLASLIFSALADAEVTYHRRFLYAKCFTALTSSRRSRASHLPHFRLKNVGNIKAWLSLRGGRSWLKRQGRQRAADEIVSTSFLIVLLFLAVMGVQAVSETLPNSPSLFSTLVHTEVTLWCLLSSFFLLRFMMLGSNINRKYQNTSLLLTEQMNVYLKLLITPHKKEKLLISNNVLKLASKLLKELNSPNKISGLTMNPLLYNITRVVVLSAFSSALSEMFGFKLKLWKMKV
ncbi:homeodomain transcription factor [Achlya hypogyna]|uniref:Homeodomain transcription factor n=1 Tax=Achlya hypogyna TaxID=1202772 RepID=A0A1V9Z6U2_ACHHY|nr:homeodomain transcription factor [Achlya hypogyna]